MNQELRKITTFTDLDAWQEGHKFVLAIYKTTTDFPNEEVFGLTSQIRRAAVSITSNIAEGFSRYSYREKAQFYQISLGSVTEVQNQLLIARDVGYLVSEEFNPLAKQAIKIHKIINGLIKSSRTIIPNS
ncbi:MAG: four helix bundle protein [Patescibacteria group bacterium]